MGEAEAAEALGDYKAAVTIYEDLAGSKTTVNEDILSRWRAPRLATGDAEKAAEAYLRVYYEFPLSDAAIAADTQLDSLRDQTSRAGCKADIGRAQILYGARRYPEARAAFASHPGPVVRRRSRAGRPPHRRMRLLPQALRRGARRRAAVPGERLPQGGSAILRAERPARARQGRRVHRRDAPRWSTSSRTARGPRKRSTTSATYYILTNEDELAAKTFREMYEKFPNGTRAERAAWKYGWYQYKTGEYAETVRVFESAAARLRAIRLPAVLPVLGGPGARQARQRLVRGRAAAHRPGGLRQLVLRPAGRTSCWRRRADQARGGRGARVNRQVLAAAAPALPTDRLIRLLLAAGLYDDALNELRFAQRAWGPSAAVDATIAWVYYRKGELRRAITLMRRAYPQHLTSLRAGAAARDPAGHLPADLLGLDPEVLRRPATSTRT